MVIQGQERADDEQRSAWAPLRSGVYRNLFIAQFVSNVGTFMQGVAAQWFLVEKHSRGALATREGLRVAMMGSALVLGVVALSVAVLPLRATTGKLNVEVSTAWPTPTLMFEPCPQDGPVLVAVRYRVPDANLEKFVEAMSAVRRSRLRTGGHSWRLYHSVGQPNTFLERFTVASWSEFERQRTERWSEYDTDGVSTAISYTVDRSRQHGYYLAVRVRG